MNFPLKEHKIENFFGSDFEFCVISLSVMLVQHVTGTGSGLLGGNPQSGCTDVCSYSKRATVGVRAPM